MMANLLRRWRLVAPLILLAACASPWAKHQNALVEYEQAGDWNAAISETKWLIDNSLLFAPQEQRSPASDADRYLMLADFSTRAGRVSEALDALREAMILDPSCAPSVRLKLDRLPLSPSERKRIETEFAWNLTALAPGSPGWLESQRVQGGCWSYRVKQIRIRQTLVERGDSGKQRRIIYDARPWHYDADLDTWRVDGGWMISAGGEIETLGGAASTRYQAIQKADGGFFTDSSVPPCHAAGWEGPFEVNGTVFVTTQLPTAAPPHRTAPR
jgi:hypothetical protein